MVHTPMGEHVRLMLTGLTLTNRELWNGEGGPRRLAAMLLGGHTPSKNPRHISGMQAYITYLLRR
jgi:hypothetical protein